MIARFRAWREARHARLCAEGKHAYKTYGHPERVWCKWCPGRWPV